MYNVPTIYVLSKSKKNIAIFHLKIIVFTAVKNHSILILQWRVIVILQWRVIVIFQCVIVIFQCVIVIFQCVIVIFQCVIVIFQQTAVRMTTKGAPKALAQQQQLQQQQQNLQQFCQVTSRSGNT